MTFLEKLDGDILHIILRFSNLEDVPNILTTLGARLSYKERSKLKDLRSNPLTLFKQIADEPEKLMVYMFNCRVILSGSRACNYFNPTLADIDSDWDFFCLPNLICIVIFTRYLKSIGVEWTHTYVSDMPSIIVDSGESLDFRHLGGRLEKNNEIKYINLWIPFDDSKTPISCVLNFRSSIEQCFLSGFAAVSLYSKYTSKNKSLIWSEMLSTDEGFMLYNKSKRSINKWTNRSVDYTSYEEYITTVVSNKNFDTKYYLGRERVMGDEESTFIPLNKYIAKFVPIIYSNVFIEQLQDSFWVEHPYWLNPLVRSMEQGIWRIDQEILSSNVITVEDIKLVEHINKITKEYRGSVPPASKDVRKMIKDMCIARILPKVPWLHYTVIERFLGVEECRPIAC